MPNKPEIIVDLDKGALGALKALAPLSCLRDGASRHESLDRRHPLGIYNASIARICAKVQKCAERLERYMSAVPRVRDSRKEEALRDEVIDYLELCLYAAAEHVDDVEAIARCFFDNGRAYDRSPHVRQLKRAIKPLRDQISGFTNAIKHGQSRLRLFSVDFTLEGKRTCLHGVFIEAFSNGKLGPHPIFHAEDESVISVTSFLWSVATYLALISDELHAFLDSIGALQDGPHPPIPCAPFNRAIIALARLPIYSFDEVHPFERVRVVLRSDEGSSLQLKSGVYGSILHGWAKSTQGSIEETMQGYEGDGVTKAFAIVSPKKLRLQYWD